jgi:hypothetical protein
MVTQGMESRVLIPSPGGAPRLIAKKSGAANASTGHMTGMTGVYLTAKANIALTQLSILKAA